VRIGIDGHHLDGKPQGSRTYLRCLVKELARLAPHHEIFLYSFDPQATRALFDAGNVRHRRIFPKTARLRVPFIAPALALRDGLDLLHSQYICPPLSLTPEVVSIHDVLFESHPELFVGAFSRTSARLIRHSARRARRVVTGSEFSRREILERYGLPDEKVVAIPDAVDRARFRPLTAGEERERVRARYQLQQPFVLSVGRIEPRKNLVRLIRAFERVRRSAEPSLALVIGGMNDFRFEEVYHEAGRLPEGVVKFLGPVPDEDLAALYNLSTLLAFPSLVEGFGMPVLEAMACGVPVVASPRGALPEVAGDSVRWVEPEDEASIAEGLVRVLTDDRLRASLRAKGLARAEQFSWEETARRTLAVYREAVA
jgi:glycosyltransferase involved in cell wall biosynthesis